METVGQLHQFPVGLDNIDENIVTPWTHFIKYPKVKYPKLKFLIILIASFKPTHVQLIEYPIRIRAEASLSDYTFCVIRRNMHAKDVEGDRYDKLSEVF